MSDVWIPRVREPAGITPVSGPELARSRRTVSPRLSAREIAEHMHVSRARVAQIEQTAWPPADTCRRYLAALSAAVADRR